MPPIRLAANNASEWTGPTGNNTYLLIGPPAILLDAGIGDPAHVAAVARALDGALPHPARNRNRRPRRNPQTRAIRNSPPPVTFLARGAGGVRPRRGYSLANGLHEREPRPCPQSDPSPADSGDRANDRAGILESSWRTGGDRLLPTAAGARRSRHRRHAVQLPGDLRLRRVCADRDPVRLLDRDDCGRGGCRDGWARC